MNDKEVGPRIAITTGRGGMPVTEGRLAAYYVGRKYVEAVQKAGGVPVLFPAVESGMEDLVETALSITDALLLPGGADLSPTLYGADPDLALDADPVRDRFELAMLDGAVERGMAVLGICRGMELINVARGGSLQNCDDHPDRQVIEVKALGKVHVHPVDIEPDTLACRVFGDRPEVEATCVHHQAPDRLGEGLTVSGRARDGSIEVLEDAPNRLLGVIWHPELGLDRTPTHQLVYDWLIREAATDREGALHG